MHRQNNGFINKTCEICGQDCLVASKVTFEANYGSVNDGERISLDVCGCCIDKLFSIVQNNILCKGDE